MVNSIEEDLVSVVVNCYNSESFLEECISSILSQTYSNFEIIIWDNCSTDKTNVIVSKIGSSNPKVRYFKGVKFVPLGSARNFAIKECKGDWIAFLDSDDLWDSNFLYSQMKILNGNKNKYFGYGHVTEFTGIVPTVNVKKYTNSKVSSKSTFGELLSGNFIYFSSVVVSKAGIAYVEEFNENLIQAEDYDFLLRLSSKFEGVQTGHVFYRLHDNNFSKFQKLETYTENLTIMQRYLYIHKAKINYARILARFFIYSIQTRKKKNFWDFIQSHNNWVFYLIIGLISGIQNKLIKVFRQN